MIPPPDTCYEGGDQSVQRPPPVNQAEGVIIPTCVIERLTDDYLTVYAWLYGPILAGAQCDIL